MRSDDINKKIIKGLEYLDDDIVSGTLNKIKPEDERKNNRSIIRRSMWIGAAVAFAACALLLALPSPTTQIIKDFEIFRPVGADGSSDRAEILSKRDGSPGLLYEINEDGESASFIGYGSCTDDTVYIASNYRGLPVTEMHNHEVKGVGYIPHNNQVFEHIKHIVISDTVKYVDSACISWCPNIESVYFGASVDNIAGFFFPTGYGMKFSKVEVSPENPNYSDKGNCIVDLRTKTLVIGTYKTVIPDDGSVKIIGINAFCPASRRLGSIVIPEGVKFIDMGAFLGCEKLERVTLPDSLEIIESAAFRDCDKLTKLEFGSNLKYVVSNIISGSKLKEVYYRGTVAEWEKVIKQQVTRLNTVIYEIVDGEKKLIYSTQTSPIESFTVICTDGVSNSAAGFNGRYDWSVSREFEAYGKTRIPHGSFWYYDLDEIAGWFKSAEEYKK